MDKIKNDEIPTIDFTKNKTEFEKCEKVTIFATLFFQNLKKQVYLVVPRNVAVEIKDLKSCLCKFYNEPKKTTRYTKKDFTIRDYGEVLKNSVKLDEESHLYVSIKNV